MYVSYLECGSKEGPLPTSALSMLTCLEIIDERQSGCCAVLWFPNAILANLPLCSKIEQDRKVVFSNLDATLGVSRTLIYIHRLLFAHCWFQLIMALISSKMNQDYDLCRDTWAKYVSNG